MKLNPYGIRVTGTGKHAWKLWQPVRAELRAMGAPMTASMVLLALILRSRASFFSNALKVRLLNAYYGNTAVAPPANLFVGLSTTTPDQAGANFTEPTGGAYARVSVTNNTTNWPTATTANPSVKSNGAAVTFPQATANWGTVTYWGIFEASTGGVPTDMAALTASQAINTGTTASFAIGQLTSQITG